jgi:hypothetical protein
VQHHIVLNPHLRAGGLQEFLGFFARLARLIAIGSVRRF